ncbi:hypothetical protein [Nostoc sp.]|uniref:hypothetical protein n=1 Tax=Nostoc sp. TaxID=1180 RepID=UPI002FF4F3DA
MKNNINLESALKQEFGCYYLADELQEEWEDSLSQMAWASASRLGDRVGENNIQDLIQLLKDARNDPNHTVIQMICNETLVDWIDEPTDWQVLQNLLDMIIMNLKQEAD